VLHERRPGPVDDAELAHLRAAGLAAAGAVTADTLVWSEGQPGWLALRDCAELQAHAAAAAPGGAPAAPAGAGPDSNGAAAAGAAPPAKRGRVAAVAKAVRAAPADRADPELDAFRAEISAIDGGASGAPALAGAAAAAPDPEPPVTPPEGEREFEDDDGTLYAWDPALRKFVAREAPPGGAGAPPAAAQAAPDYGVADMTFEADEEVLPEYKPPAPDSDAEDEGEGRGAGGARDPAGDPAADAGEARRRGAGEAGTSGRAPAGEEGAGADASAAGAAGGATPAEGGAAKQTRSEAVMEKHREKQKRAREVRRAQPPARPWPMVGMRAARPPSDQHSLGMRGRGRVLWAYNLQPADVRRLARSGAACSDRHA